jgi:hypothetical protein
MASPVAIGTSGANLLETGPDALFLQHPQRQEGSGLPSPDLPDSSWIGAPGYTAPPQRMEPLEPATGPAIRSLATALTWEITTPPSGPEADSASIGSIPEKRIARLVVLGDSDVLRDGTIDLYGNNAFVSRLFGWLSEREFLLRFPPPDRSGTPLEVGLAGLRTSFFVVQIVLPLLVYIVGFVLWVRRR